LSDESGPEKKTYGTLGRPGIWMTCGLGSEKAPSKKRKTDGEWIRVVRKSKKLMMGDVLGEMGYSPAVGAGGQSGGQRSVTGGT